ncbi:hypothetical protein FN846DRAFT_910976 [Sphaerosporella brunnea]|uniref:RING-type domain-containing protein n=1 Tax=Sphaerosporella brunnea TaxID=1250544 RepID=A0A5J5EM76_9PEZI|nr:hypothetical protein FN846DRAFT_910976 [Sphaerosporella brunnea]
MSNVSDIGKSLRNLGRRLTFRETDQSNKCVFCKRSLSHVMDSTCTLWPCGHEKAHYQCFRDHYLKNQFPGDAFCPVCGENVDFVSTRATGGGNLLTFEPQEMERREVCRPAR